MEPKLISVLNKHKIYLIDDKNNNIKCLVSLPNQQNYPETSISIDLKTKEELDKLDFDKNDENWIKDNIINLYKPLDEYNITLVIPIFTDIIIEDYLKNKNEGVYIEMSKLMSYIINNAYSLLKSVNVTVKNNDAINLMSAVEYECFVNWFSNKLPSRINKTTLGKVIDEQTSHVKNYEVVETPNMNFVVGKITPPSEESKNIINKDLPITQLDNPVQPKKLTKTEPPKTDNQGFIGYYLLTAIIVVVCFIIFYIVM